jgi:hypothetical protein
MGTIVPEGQRIRQAIKWISAERQADESRSFGPLIVEAAQRFNLSPKEEEDLRGFYRGAGREGG